VVAVNLWFFDHPEQSGIFNLGTGRAQPFNDVAMAVVNTRRAAACRTRPRPCNSGLLDYVAFPDALRGKYQCYTQADLTALRAAGCDHAFADVQTGWRSTCVKGVGEKRAAEFSAAGLTVGGAAYTGAGAADAKAKAKVEAKADAKADKKTDKPVTEKAKDAAVATKDAVKGAAVATKDAVKETAKDAKAAVTTKKETKAEVKVEAAKPAASAAKK
jgi:hypothetical protein